jgi:hypothetical protein
MIYLVIFLLAVIILLLFFILRLKSKETFVLDNPSNKPKIDNYNIDNYSYLTEVKKFEIIPNEIQLSKEDIYLNAKSSEGWELFKKENILDDKIKYYWRKKII